MTVTKPFFSVIIPTYNRESFLAEAIESVLSQTYSDFELLIIDDGSEDSTPALVQRFADNRLRYITRPHSGISPSRNAGIAASTGQYIAFLDSDDRFKPEKLATAAHYIKQFPKIMVFHTEELWFRNGKILNQKRIHKKPDGYVFEQALRLCCIGMSTSVIRRNIFEKVGLFDESLPACEDYDLWLRITCCFPVKLIPHVLTVKHGGHVDQLSRTAALDRFRIQALDTLLQRAKLSPKQKTQTIEELRRKAAIYINGATKHGNTAEAEKYSHLLQKYAE